MRPPDDLPGRAPRERSTYPPADAHAAGDLQRRTDVPRPYVPKPRPKEDLSHSPWRTGAAYELERVALSRRRSPWATAGVLVAIAMALALAGLLLSTAGCSRHPRPEDSAALTHLGRVASGACLGETPTTEDCSMVQVDLALLGVAIARPEVPQDLMTLLTGIGGRIIDAAMDWLFSRIGGGQGIGASSLGVRATAAAANGTQSLTLIRSWDRPASPAQRVRLGAGADGGLRVVWQCRVAGSSWRITIEDASGAELWSRRIQVRVPKLSPAWPVPGSDRPLYLDGGTLRLGDEALPVAGAEAYAALPATAVAFAPCPSPPCSSALMWRSDSGTWSGVPWGVALFGVALSPGASGTVAVASREQGPAGASRGWTLRVVDEDALESGVVTEVQPLQRWIPPAGLSLEDPFVLVSTGHSVFLVGEAFDLLAGPHTCPPPNGTKPCGANSGRVFIAESGGQLREVLQVAATLGNSEVHAAEVAGDLYLTAELDADHSALWRWQSGRFVQVSAIQGSAPYCTAAQEALWIATTQGLWRLE